MGASSDRQFGSGINERVPTDRHPRMCRALAADVDEVESSMKRSVRSFHLILSVILTLTVMALLTAAWLAREGLT